MGVFSHRLSGRVIGGTVLLAAMLAAWPGISSSTALAQQLPSESVAQTPSGLDQEQWFYEQRSFGLGRDGDDPAELNDEE